MSNRFLCLLICLTALLPGSSLAATHQPLWVLADQAGDDYGDGTLKYPMNEDFQRGDLDLLSLAAFRETDGTRFEATFARKIKAPPARTIDGLGTTLDKVAPLGFYTLNIDIYIDTDRVSGSGSTATLPGRKVMVDPASAWEKVICLTPDPKTARNEMSRIVNRAETRRARAEKRTRDLTDEFRRQLRQSVDAYLFFPTEVRVFGNRIEFFVPDSFLGGEAKATWAYTVAVSGADVIQRTDQQGRIQRIGDTAEALMILPVTVGRPVDRFGGGREDDAYHSPIIDVITPAGVEQRRELGEYDSDSGTPAVLKAVVPADVK